MTEGDPGCKGRGGNPRIEGDARRISRGSVCAGAGARGQPHASDVGTSETLQVIQRPTYLPRSVAEIDDFEVKTLRRQQHQRFRA